MEVDVNALNQKEIAAGEFKARCLQLMDEVNQDGIEIVITKRGRPVARLVPVRKEKLSPIGWMEGTVEIHSDIVNSDPDDWEERPLFPDEDE
jgi:prevent-host-death family protein